MGKKKVAQQSQEDVLREQKAQDDAIAQKGQSEVMKRVTAGRVYINSTYNNTHITLTDQKGGVLAWASAGSLGFSGPKKATPFAASKVIATLAEKVKKLGMLDVDVIVAGVGSGRDSAIRSLGNHGFNVMSLTDATPIPHNGPRPKKVRRI
ncbi:MAG: 30S ribosomal protein S11 [Candidatus Liptonbacteria bacterium]|nr:30S ribosomal protein S11 [Candidatus Liptonbacteria bacterium]